MSVAPVIRRSPNCLSLSPSSTFSLPPSLRSFCSPAIFHMEEQGMGLCVVKPHAPCPRWLLRLTPPPQPHSPSLTAPHTSPHRCVSQQWTLRGMFGFISTYKWVEWSFSTVVEVIQSKMGMDACTSLVPRTPHRAQKHLSWHTLVLTRTPHTCILADNYPNSQNRQECPCGPCNHFRQGPWCIKDLRSLSMFVLLDSMNLICVSSWHFGCMWHAGRLSRNVSITFFIYLFLQSRKIWDPGDKVHEGQRKNNVK